MLASKVIRNPREIYAEWGEPRMTTPAPPSGLQPEDYERIEEAVMETARGRWFLLEYARRQRAAESERLLAAIERLERRVARGAGAAAVDEGGLAERLQDFAWTLRERGLDESVCGELEAMAQEAAGTVDPGGGAEPATDAPPVAAPVAAQADAPIPAAASLASEGIPTPETGRSFDEGRSPPALPSLTGRRIASRFAEVGAGRLREAAEGCGGGDAPARRGECQPVPDPRLVALSRLDQLPLAERLALFG